MAILDGLGEGLRDATGAREWEADTDGTTCARDGDGDCDATTAWGFEGDAEGEAAGDADGMAADTDGEAESAGFDGEAEADGTGDDDGDGRTAETDGVADGTTDGLGEGEAATPPEHCMESTNEPVTVLNPSTEMMWCPLFPVTPDIMEFRVFEVQLAELSDNWSWLNIPSVNRRMTVSMLLPHVLNV